MVKRILIAAIVILVGGAGALSYWQLKTYSGTRSTHEVVLSAPAGRVWEHLTDNVKRSDWVNGLITVLPLSGTPGQKDARSLLVMLSEGRRFEVEEKIIDTEPGVWLGLKTTSLAAILTTTFTLEQLGPADAPTAKIRLTFQQDTQHLTWQGKLLAPFLRMAAETTAQRDLERLKQIVERAD
ncbi:MAG: SRPBCC family protein [Sphingomonadales bacterium]